MFFDPLAQQISIGGAVAVMLVATVLKFLPAFMRAMREDKNGHNRNKSGDLTPQEWEGRMARIMNECTQEQVELYLARLSEAVHNANEEQMEDIRNMMRARNEDIRRIVREEVERYERGRGR